MLPFYFVAGSLGTVRAGIKVTGRSVLGEPIINQDLVSTSWVCLQTLDWLLLVLTEL